MAPRRKTSMTSHRLDCTACDHQVPERTKAPRKKIAGLKRRTDVEEWVYRFLGNLAAIENDREKTHKKRNLSLRNKKRSRVSGWKAAQRRIRSPTPYSLGRSWTATSPILRSNAFDDDGDDEMMMVPPMTQALSAVSTGVPPGPLPRGQDRTLLQKINRYIKAGIAEGKRRARRYVRKALSFAIETGYLEPADRDGKLLRVSAALVDPSKPLHVVDRTGRGRKSRTKRSARARKRSGRAGKRRKMARRMKTSRRRKADATNAMEKKADVKKLKSAESVGPQSQHTDRATGGVSRKQTPYPSNSPSRSSSISDQRAEENKPTEDEAVRRSASRDVDQKPNLQNLKRSRSASGNRRSRDGYDGVQKNYSDETL